MVQGPPKGPSWTSHWISEKEIDKLQAFFTKVLELPEVMLEDSRHQWKNLFIVVRSLGRRVPADWVAKEVRVKSKFDNGPEIFLVAEDHIILLFERRTTVQPS